MSFFSIDEYTGDGIQTQFAVTFSFIDRTHVKVYTRATAGSAYVEDTTFTWISDGLIQPTTTPGSGVGVRIQRTSSQATPLVDYSTGTLTEEDLDTANLQAIYMAQEAIDQGSEGVGVLLPTAEANKFLQWDAQGSALENVELASLGALSIPVPVFQGGTGETTIVDTLNSYGFSTYFQTLIASANMAALQSSLEVEPKRAIQIVVDAPDSAAAVGDGAAYAVIPSFLNTYNITAVRADVQTAGTTGLLTVQIHNETQAADILSTALTVDSTETSSATAVTAAVIDAAEDDVATGDVLRIDVDTIHSGTASQGLIVTLELEPV